MADDPLQTYKTWLRALIERRPSGTRQKLAHAFGTHKSFVSQVINPAYRVPLPAQHLAALFEVCRFSDEEQQTFLALYQTAHPSARRNKPGTEPAEFDQMLEIDLPDFGSKETAQMVRNAILDHARHVIALAVDRDARSNQTER